MLTDLVIVAIAAGMGVWGYTRGANIAVLAAAGFGIGGVLGSRIGPQLLDGGIHDPLAPAAGLPGGLLLGGLMAAVFERAGYEAHRRWLRRRRTIDAIVGAVLAVLLGVVVVWILGAVATRVDGLQSTVRDSEIVAQLNSALPPPGPVKADTDEFYLSPALKRPGAKVLPVSDRIKRDPQVEAAQHAVVKITARGCGAGISGSGWIAADGIVVTNSHVVERTEQVRVLLEGEGVPREATPISFDENADLSVLSVPSLKGVRRLRVADTPKLNTHAAVLGYPFGERYKARAARVGPTVEAPTRGRPGDPIQRIAVTFLRIERLGPGPGSSGGPVVNDRGQVVGTIFAGFLPARRRGERDLFQFAIAGPVIKRHLARIMASPRRRADTGDCEGD